MQPPRRSFATIATAIACALASVAIQPAAAAADPHLLVRRDNWTSSTGACEAKFEHATVVGVPADVKARIDGFLERALASESTSYQDAPYGRPARVREVVCAKGIAANAPYAKEREFATIEAAVWTPGFARGRWLSTRLHVMNFAGGAHGSDTYFAITFDLDHGGYPVPASGFYTNAQRARFNHALFTSQVAVRRSNDPDGPLDADDIESLRQNAQALNVQAAQILLTSAGIEVTGMETSEAARSEVVKVSFSALRGIGTPGGPLDPATR